MLLLLMKEERDFRFGIVAVNGSGQDETAIGRR